MVWTQVLQSERTETSDDVDADPPYFFQTRKKIGYRCQTKPNVWSELSPPASFIPLGMSSVDNWLTSRSHTQCIMKADFFLTPNLEI